jgi:hypothetical protein
MGFIGQSGAGHIHNGLFLSLYCQNKPFLFTHAVSVRTSLATREGNVHHAQPNLDIQSLQLIDICGICK